MRSSASGRSVRFSFPASEIVFKKDKNKEDEELITYQEDDVNDGIASSVSPFCQFYMDRCAENDFDEVQKIIDQLMSSRDPPTQLDISGMVFLL